MKKHELKALVNKLFVRHGIEENHVGFYKGLAKKELKLYVNENGGFTKGKVKTLAFDPKDTDTDHIPEGAFRFEATLSDESINMNGYRILLSARQEGFKKYFEDYEGSVYLQHDMDQPIGKTLSIQVDTEYLTATGYAYDDLTDKRVSRGLIRDISTGHVPNEIKYINKDTGQELTPGEFSDMLRDMIDEMRDARKTWEEIKQAIADMREIWVETHMKVQIVEYSFVSVGANTSAGVKSITNNTIEKLEAELPEDIELEDAEEENTDTTDAQESNTTENDLENEGETPEGGEGTDNSSENEVESDKQDDAGETPEEPEQLEPHPAEAENAVLKEQLALKNAEIQTLKAENEELSTYNNSKKVVVQVSENKTPYNTKSTNEILFNVNKLLGR